MVDARKAEAVEIALNSGEQYLLNTCLSASLMVLVIVKNQAGKEGRQDIANHIQAMIDQMKRLCEELTFEPLNFKVAKDFANKVADFFEESNDKPLEHKKKGS